MSTALPPQHWDGILELPDDPVRGQELEDDLGKVIEEDIHLDLPANVYEQQFQLDMVRSHHATNIFTHRQKLDALLTLADRIDAPKPLVENQQAFLRWTFYKQIEEEEGRPADQAEWDRLAKESHAADQQERAWQEAGNFVPPIDERTAVVFARSLPNPQARWQYFEYLQQIDMWTAHVSHELAAHYLDLAHFLSSPPPAPPRDERYTGRS